MGTGVRVRGVRVRGVRVCGVRVCGVQNAARIADDATAERGAHRGRGWGRTSRTGMGTRRIPCITTARSCSDCPVKHGLGHAGRGGGKRGARGGCEQRLGPETGPVRMGSRLVCRDNHGPWKPLRHGAVGPVRCPPLAACTSKPTAKPYRWREVPMKGGTGGATVRPQYDPFL